MNPAKKHRKRLIRLHWAFVRATQLFKQSVGDMTLPLATSMSEAMQEASAAIERGDLDTAENYVAVILEILLEDRAA